MKPGDILYVRTDCKVDGVPVTEKDYADHLNYLKGISKERNFMGGGYKNKDGGMIIFSARDLAEARSISDKDPLIARKQYTYQLLEWELVILSQLK